MLIPKLLGGMHLVLTGGSPLLQQNQLFEFIKAIYVTYQFKPYIEVENECVITPGILFADCVDCWNNSPKLLSSGMAGTARYNPSLLLEMAGLKNSWFKFVIEGPEQWKEIEEMYLKTELIQKKQVILMPRGETPEELSKYRELTFNMATENNVIYSDRVHIVLFGKKIGV
jgi:organic radical activating enzyme